MTLRKYVDGKEVFKLEEANDEIHREKQKYMKTMLKEYVEKYSSLWDLDGPDDEREFFWHLFSIIDLFEQGLKIDFVPGRIVPYRVYLKYVKEELEKQLGRSHWEEI